MTVANLTRTFGVEMEVNTNLPADTLASAINAEFWARGIAQRCEAQGYNHTTQSIWKIVQDGTVRPGWEIVSPPMTLAEGKAQLEAVCSALQSLDCWVSRQTGLHVHHDARNLTGTQVGQAFATYATFQDILSQMVAPSRRNNTYARPLSWDRITQNGTDKFDSDSRALPGHVRPVPGDIESKIQNRVGGRYVTMNIQAVLAHGTIEFRQHQGSLNATKIFSWVLITQSIIESAVQGTARSLKPTSVIRAEGKPNAFRKRGEFARFRDTVGVSPSANKVPMSQGDPATWTPAWQAVEDACNDYYVPAFRYFAQVVKKFAAS